MTRRIPCGQFLFGLLTGLAFVGASYAGESTGPPITIDTGNVAKIELPFKADYHLRQPLWAPEEAGSLLALQAYLAGGFRGLVIAKDVNKQLASGRVAVSLQIPAFDFAAPAARSAILMLGTWYAVGDGVDLVYSANASAVRGAVQYPSSAPYTIWRQVVLGGTPETKSVCDTRVSGQVVPMTFPSSVPGQPIIVSEMGRWGTANSDIAAFTIVGGVAYNLTKTDELAESTPLLCPNPDPAAPPVVAYLESDIGEPSPALNCLLITSARDGSMTATRQYQDRGAESRRNLGTVSAFSWCPRTFRDPNRGSYGLIAYYRQEISKQSESDVHHELWIVPVSLKGKILANQAFRVHSSVSVESSKLDITPPAWDPSGEYLYFLEFKPGTNPLWVARITSDMHLAGNKAPVPAWPLNAWAHLESAPVNLSVSCSGDGNYLAIVAVGRAPHNENIQYDQAYVLPVRKR